MSRIERIIENVDATMRMEGLPLSPSDKERGRLCLEGERTFEEVISELVSKYKED